MLNIVNNPCKQDKDGTVSARTVKLGTHTSYEIRTTPIAFQGRGQRSSSHAYYLLFNHVNKIKTELFGLGPSNLVHILAITRGWYVLLFKVRGLRSRSKIANYNVNSLLNSPVGHILLCLHCSSSYCLQSEEDCQLRDVWKCRENCKG